MSIFDRDQPRHSRDETIDRGHRAARLLGDDLFREVYERAQWKLVETWASQQSTAERREACWAGLHALQCIEAELRVLVEDAEIAKQ